MAASEKRNFLKNLTAVGLIQGLGYVLPLLTLPYLLTTLGASKLGIIGIAQAATSFFVVLVDYGFNLIGTREVAVHRDHPDKINQLFASIFTTKVVLWLAAALIYGAIVLAVPQYRQEWALFALTFGITISTVLIPVWLLQGLEKFTLLHLINTGYRLLYTAAIFLWIHQPEDVLWVPIFNATTAMVGGAFGLWWCYKQGIRFAWASTEVVIQELRSGFGIFLSGLGVNTVTSAPLLVLGFYSSAKVVGYFNFIDKFILFFRLVIRMLGSVAFPMLSRAVKHNVAQAKKLLVGLVGVGSFLAVFGAVLLYFTAEPIARLLVEEDTTQLTRMIQWLVFIPLVYLWRNLSELSLIALYQNKRYTTLTLATAAFQLLALWILTKHWGYQGAYVSIYLAELLLVGLSIFTILKKWPK